MQINVNHITRTIRIEVVSREIKVNRVTRNIQVNHVGRRGLKGDTGETGPQGEPGDDAPSDHTLLSNIGTNTHPQIDTHIANTSNPHSVTKTQVGLGNVDNISDANKPVSTAQATADALNLKISSNLSDLNNATTARTNLGLGSFAIISTLAHSALTGLSADDHSQYALLAGRSGGQTIIGGTAASNNLVLSSTSNATKGEITADSPLGFSSVAAGDRIRFSGNTYGIGIESPGSLTAWAHTQHKWRTSGTSVSSGTERMALAPTQLTIGDATGSMNAVLRGTSYNGFTASVYSDAASPYSFFYRYRGTIGSPTQVTSGSYLGSFGFRGTNELGAINIQDAARFSAISEEDITSSSQKTALVFFVARNNNIGALEGFRVSGTGNLTVGYVSDIGSRFSVNRIASYVNGRVATNGTTTLTGTGTDFINFFRVGDTITVTGETSRTITAIASDTSLTVSVAFSTTASNLAYSAGSTSTPFRVQANGNIGINQTNPQARLHFGASTTANDGIQFGTDTNLYRSAADTLKTDDDINIGGRLIIRATDTPGGTVPYMRGNTSYLAINSGSGGALYLNQDVVQNININQSKSIFTSAGQLQLTVAGTTGGLLMGGDTNLYRSSSNTLATDDDLSLKTAGKGLQIKEGSNAKMGVATLVAGTVTVANTSVTANSRIMLTVQSLGTVAIPTAVAVTARTAATSFTITSADATDTSVVAYNLIEPSA